MGPELDLRPQLERLDRLICWSEDIDEGALSFAFRPLWQLDEPARAALALTRAQATQVYAGLKLWPDAMVARLAEAQLVADGTYPNAAAVFAEGRVADTGEHGVADAFPADLGALHYLTEPRNRTDPGEKGRWIQGEDDPGDLLTLTNFHSKEERERRKEKRLKRQKRKHELRELREAEEQKRQELAEKHGGSDESVETGPTHAGKPTTPPTNEREELPPKRPTFYSFLPDTDRDGFELPAGVTPREAIELHLHDSPTGISFEYRGKSTTAIGDEYSTAVNAYIGAEKPLGDFKAGALNPDGAMLVRQGRQNVVIESKCIENWSKSVYNPDYNTPFKHEVAEDIVDQSLKYARKYDRVDRYMNSLDFVRVYAKKFKAAGIQNFTFTVIPAVRPRP